MSYKELFSAIECNRIVIIEDDFKQGEYKKERALYDITRMAVDDRCRYLAEIESISQPLHEVLSKFLSLFDECFDKIGVWDDSITPPSTCNERILYSLSLFNSLYTFPFSLQTASDLVSQKSKHNGFCLHLTTSGDFSNSKKQASVFLHIMLNLQIHYSFCCLVNKIGNPINLSCINKLFIFILYGIEDKTITIVNNKSIHLIWRNAQ